MKGWILYKRRQDELTNYDHGVMRLLESAQKKGIALQVFQPSEFDIVAGDGQHRLYYQNQSVELPDFVLPRLGADTPYHALMLLKCLESLGVICCNHSESIATVKDKMHMGLRFADHGLPTPKTMLLQFPPNLDLIEKEIGFPIVIKNVSGVRGVGVCLAERNGFKDLMSLLGTQATEAMLLQSFIQSSYGRDLRVFVLGQEVIGCMLREAKEGFKANYSLGGTVMPYPVTEEIKQLALKTAHLFGLEIAGIDLLFGESGFYVCEANSSPGFKGMEEATHKDIASEILDYVTHKVNVQ